jgi:hypothetical protein
MGKMRLPFIDSDLLYRGALQGRFDCIMKMHQTLITLTKIVESKWQNNMINNTSCPMI